MNPQLCNNARSMGIMETWKSPEHSFFLYDSNIESGLKPKPKVKYQLYTQD